MCFTVVLCTLFWNLFLPCEHAYIHGCMCPAVFTRASLHLNQISAAFEIKLRTFKNFFFLLSVSHEQVKRVLFTFSLCPPSMHGSGPGHLFHFVSFLCALSSGRESRSLTCSYSRELCRGRRTWQSGVSRGRKDLLSTKRDLARTLMNGWPSTPRAQPLPWRRLT